MDPEIVIAEPPGARVEPPMMNCDAELAVNVVDGRVITSGASEDVASGVVSPFTTMADADGAREYVDPDTTIAEPPGMRVEPARMNCDAELAVKVVDGSVITCVASGGGARGVGSPVYNNSGCGGRQ